MARLLPVGAEYEYQTRPFMGASDSRVIVFRYRVVGHSLCAESIADGSRTYFTCRVEPVAMRYRHPIETRVDGVDMYGRPIWRCEYDGAPPSPTWDDVIKTKGVDVVAPTPKSRVRKNIAKVERARDADK